jgi:hypothetical protein
MHACAALLLGVPALRLRQQRGPCDCCLAHTRTRVHRNALWRVLLDTFHTYTEACLAVLLGRCLGAELGCGKGVTNSVSLPMRK